MSIIEKNQKKGQSTGILIRKELDDAISHASVVFVTGHINPDYDSIGSNAGIYALAKAQGKDVYIVLDDKKEALDTDMQKILLDMKYNESDKNYKTKLKIITLDEYEKIRESLREEPNKDEHCLLVMTDVNQAGRTCFRKKYDEFKKIIVIDHHEENENTIDRPNVRKFIYPDASSASELLTQAIFYGGNTKSNVEIKKTNKNIQDIYTLLYAGIQLDTKRFKTNKTTAAHTAVQLLCDNGANKEYVNKLFRKDGDSYFIIANLTFGRRLREYRKDLKEQGISFCLNRNNKFFPYKQSELARSSDILTGIKDTDTSFTIGYRDDENIGISARSESLSVDVGNILNLFCSKLNFTLAKKFHPTEIKESNFEDLTPQRQKEINSKYSYASGGGSEKSAGGYIALKKILKEELSESVLDEIVGNKNLLEAIEEMLIKEVEEDLQLVGAEVTEVRPVIDTKTLDVQNAISKIISKFMKSLDEIPVLNYVPILKNKILVNLENILFTELSTLSNQLSVTETPTREVQKVYSKQKININ